MEINEKVRAWLVEQFEAEGTWDMDELMEHKDNYCEQFGYYFIPNRMNKAFKRKFKNYDE